MPRMRILAVDDNVVNLATLEQELKDKYEVIPMISGRRAIKFLQSEDVDLVLLDVQMPVMDGLETLQEIRTLENGVTLPVIFLTSTADKVVLLEGSKLGIMDYILKPFDSFDLHERIEKALKRRGVLPIDGTELYQRVKEVRDYILNEKYKPALTKTEEILGYQLEEDVQGRMANVKIKLEAADYEGAERMLDRIIKMMKKSGRVSDDSDAPPISLGEMNSRLLYILTDLENYDIKEALAKLDDLLCYELPPVVFDGCKKARGKLAEYDDDEAEKLIRDVLSEL